MNRPSTAGDGEEVGRSIKAAAAIEEVPTGRVGHQGKRWPRPGGGGGVGSKQEEAVHVDIVVVVGAVQSGANTQWLMNFCARIVHESMFLRGQRMTRPCTLTFLVRAGFSPEYAVCI